LPAVKRLLLLGGGHSHVEVIRRFGERPLREVQITLVSPERHTPYSGMLPGYVAGHYGYDDCHIDLEPLCGTAGVVFRPTEASEIQPEAGRVVCSDGSVVSYDVLSINVGSTPDVDAMEGAREYGIRVKPVAEFLGAWERILAALRDGQRQSLAFVGGGAGAVELAAAVHHRLAAEGFVQAARIVLLTDAASILPTHAARAQRILTRVLIERGVELHCGAKVVRVAPGQLDSADGSSLKADHAVLATGASAPAWIASAGLEIDRRGFLAVNAYLQSQSHPNVFAAGDVATMIDNPRPKMGVYAVRQGPVLHANLQRALAGEPLHRYAPQKSALALISTGNKHAVASWNGIAFEGDWVWHWKDRIDRRFMATYRRSPV